MQSIPSCKYTSEENCHLTYFCVACLIVSPALAGKTHGITLSRDDDVIVWCCRLLWKQVNIWRYLRHASVDFNLSWVIDATWEPAFDEVKGHIHFKGHLRSSCKIGRKCKSGLIWKVEVRLEPNLVYWYNMGPFVCSYGQRSYTKVKL